MYRIGQEEIAEFAKTVASKDGDDSNFTLKDMMGSYEQMQTNNFKVGDFAAINNNFFANKDIVYYHDKSDLSLWKKWVNKFWKPVRLYNTKNFQFYKIVKNKK
jgi:hypothetical protein